MNAGAPTTLPIQGPLAPVCIARPLRQPQTAKTNHKILRLRFPALVKTCGSPPALRMRLVGDRAQGMEDRGQQKENATSFDFAQDVIGSPHSGNRKQPKPTTRSFDSGF